jgi:hypothetical protein
MVKFGEMKDNKGYSQSYLDVLDTRYENIVGMIKRQRIGDWSFYPVANINHDETELTQIVAKLKELNG